MSVAGETIPVIPGQVTLSTLRAVARANRSIDLDAAAWKAVADCHLLLQRGHLLGLALRCRSGLQRVEELIVHASHLFRRL